MEVVVVVGGEVRGILLRSRTSLASLILLCSHLARTSVMIYSVGAEAYLAANGGTNNPLIYSGNL